jgi:hypothetical protein
MSYLYGGVSAENHSQFGGRLMPAGRNVRIVMMRNDLDFGVEMFRDGTFERVASENNTVRGHQLVSGIHDGCFISTTKKLHIALRFATNEGTVVGFVYVLDSTKFLSFGIVSQEFCDARYPDEEEVSIRSIDGREIPREVISKIVPVRAGDYAKRFSLDSQFLCAR